MQQTREGWGNRGESSTKLVPVVAGQTLLVARRRLLGVRLMRPMALDDPVWHRRHPCSVPARNLTQDNRPVIVCHRLQPWPGYEEGLTTTALDDPTVRFSHISSALTLYRRFLRKLPSLSPCYCQLQVAGDVRLLRGRQTHA